MRRECGGEEGCYNSKYDGLTELPFEQRLEGGQGGATCTSLKEDSRPRWCQVPKTQGKYWCVQERPRDPDGKVVAVELR